MSRQNKSKAERELDDYIKTIDAPIESRFGKKHIKYYLGKKLILVFSRGGGANKPGGYEGPTNPRHKIDRAVQEWKASQ